MSQSVDASSKNINLYIPTPLGFCAGVTNAIDASNKLFTYIKERPIYFYHTIVHNNSIKSEFERNGAVFVEDLNLVPDGSYVIFSAHGVSEAIEELALRKRLKSIDLTCPLVQKVHREAIGFQKIDCDIIYIGTKNHQESSGTIGRIKNTRKFYVVEHENDIENLKPIQTENLAYISQTTLNVDHVRLIVQKLKQKFPKIQGNDLNDICGATKNRQGALKNIIQNYPIDLVLVIGSDSSSNSNKLVEVGSRSEENKSIPSFLIDNHHEIKPEWLENKTSIALTAGASAPQILIDEAINYFREKHNAQVHYIKFTSENTKFHPPKTFRELEKNYINAQ